MTRTVPQMPAADSRLGPQTIPGLLIAIPFLWCKIWRLRAANAFLSMRLRRRGL